MFKRSQQIQKIEGIFAISVQGLEVNQVCKESSDEIQSDFSSVEKDKQND